MTSDVFSAPWPRWMFRHHLKDLLHICLDPEVQVYGMTFRVCNLGSKQFHLYSAYVVSIASLSHTTVQRFWSNIRNTYVPTNYVFKSNMTLKLAIKKDHFYFLFWNTLCFKDQFTRYNENWLSILLLCIRFILCCKRMSHYKWRVLFWNREL